MESDLVRRLRTCPAQERKDVALELAHTGTNRAVAELIRMTKGRRRHWFTWYNFDDALIGVEALGESRSKRGLEYLRKISSYTKGYVQNHVVSQWTSGTTITRGEERNISFPYAPTILRDQLPYDIWWDSSHPPEPEDEIKQLKRNTTYKTIALAIEILRGSA